jgi:hypothetical protein
VSPREVAAAAIALMPDRQAMTRPLHDLGAAA